MIGFRVSHLSGAAVVFDKARRVLARKADALLGRLMPLRSTLDAMAARPYELHLELTNLCNANCVFCPYQFQERSVQYMSEEVARKALGDFVRSGGGSVGLTPIVGDALIHPKFLEFVRFVRAEPAIDRIWVTTNGILLDKHGVDATLSSGLTSITISTSGFDESSYKRIYRSPAYARMHRNVLDLVRANRRMGSPVEVTIGLRTDRPLKEVLEDRDFQEILEYEPAIDFTWSFTSAGGRIRRETLPSGMRLRVVATRRETCVQLFNGPIVLPDGTVMACSCVASMDAVNDLGIGNVLAEDLTTLHAGERMRALRESFGTSALNGTCAKCDMYRDLELYRTREGRARARVSAARGRGELARRGRPNGAFAGG
jgi:MoaA/NifB/PqqE/SkfB family radical SAM enzyme